MEDKGVVTMSNSKTVSLTKAGYKELQAKLEYLKNEGRTEAAEKLKLARSFGDLSENSEYDEAKNDQARLEKKIADLEEALKNAVIIDTDNVDKSEVYFGATVKVWDEEFEEEIEYTVVGSKEVDPKNNKISSDSPLGRALIGKKVNDKVQVVNDKGEVLSEFKVLEIL